MPPQNKTWLGTIFAKIASWLTGASSAIHDTTVVADNLVNAIKNATTSTVGQLLETGIEMIIPASTGLIGAFNGWLNVTVVALNWAVAEEGKTQEQVVADAIAYLNKLKASNPDAYAAQLNTLNALIQKWFSDNNGLGLTMQAALMTAQAVHDPSLASLTNVIGTIEQAVAPVIPTAYQAPAVDPIPAAETPSEES